MKTKPLLIPGTPPSQRGDKDQPRGLARLLRGWLCLSPRLRTCIPPPDPIPTSVFSIHTCSVTLVPVPRHPRLKLNCNKENKGYHQIFKRQGAGGPGERQMKTAVKIWKAKANSYESGKQSGEAPLRASLFPSVDAPLLAHPTWNKREMEAPVWVQLKARLSLTGMTVEPKWSSSEPGSTAVLGSTPIKKPDSCRVFFCCCCCLRFCC